MRIGIFGGCFNPPHNMHKKIGLELISKNYVDKIIYLPTGDHYPKKELASAKDRYQMLVNMLKNENEIEVSDYEIEHKSYTYETLDYFQKKYKNDKIYFVCGTDNLMEFYTWKNYQEILKKYKLLVINRNNQNDCEILNKYIEFKDNIKFISLETKVLSSTEIRKLLKEKKSKLSDKIDNRVLKYIQDNKLYEG